LKHHLSVSVGAAIAALAFSTAICLADTAPGEKVNSTVPGSPGYTGAAPLQKPHHKRTVTQKAVGESKKKAAKTNSTLPSSPPKN
jgi:hypothetical protein